MSKKIKVCFVCLGNICRSPAADGIARVIKKEYSCNFEIDSCGTAGWHIGNSPDLRMIETASNYGYDLSQLRGRQISNMDFEKFDYLVAMDEANYQCLIEMKQANSNAKVSKLLDYSIGGDVPDPYYGGIKGFEQCFELIEEGVKSFFDNLCEKHNT